MTDERFNVYQLEVIKRCFDIVKEEVIQNTEARPTKCLISCRVTEDRDTGTL